MSEDNPHNSGRKRARAQKAKKRDEDVLEEGDGDEKSKDKPVDIPEASATRRGEDSGDEPQEAAKSEADEKPATEQPASTPAKKPAEAAKEPAVDPIEKGEAWLEELFDHMQLQLTASGRFDDPNYVFDVTGSDADDLIGRSRRSPRLLSAMQVLLTEHLGDDADGSVLVDVGGFKQKRQKQLAGVADKLAETVRDLDKSLTVAGFSRYERRIIHQRLKDVDGVKTESVGHGVFRKLRVLAD